MVKLDILSDPICPWCYIGKANLDRALERAGDHPFAIEWHPFQLNPDMPAAGMDRRAYLEAKFGGKDGAVKAYAPVVEHAKKAGLTINFEAIQTTPNTLDAHRLIHWAGLEERQTPVVSGLFRAYFVDGRNIGDAVVLADITDPRPRHPFAPDGREFGPHLYRRTTPCRARRPAARALGQGHRGHPRPSGRPKLT